MLGEEKRIDKIIVEKTIKKFKFYHDYHGEKMNTPHPGILIRIIFLDGSSKYLIFPLTSDAKDFGIKVVNKKGEKYNAFVKTEALISTIIRNKNELREAVAHYYNLGQYKKAENLIVGDFVQFYTKEHKSEFVKYVPIMKSSSCYVKTDGLEINQESYKNICKKIALFLEKGAFKFYESVNMFGKEKVESVAEMTLTPEERDNLIEELKKRG